MKVWFDGDSAQYHPTTGLILKPGENEFPTDQAEALIVYGVVKKQAPVGRKAPAAAAAQEKE